jgi:hypothetical protein
MATPHLAPHHGDAGAAKTASAARAAPSHPAPATPRLPTPSQTCTPQPAPCCAAGTKDTAPHAPPLSVPRVRIGEQRIRCTVRSSTHALSKSPLAPPHTGFSMCGAHSDTHTLTHPPLSVSAKTQGGTRAPHPKQPSTRTPPRLRHSADSLRPLPAASLSALLPSPWQEAACRCSWATATPRSS